MIDLRTHSCRRRRDRPTHKDNGEWDSSSAYGIDDNHGSSQRRRPLHGLYNHAAAPPTTTPTPSGAFLWGRIRRSQREITELSHLGHTRDRIARGPCRVRM
jgi:hypothetical protein